MGEQVLGGGVIVLVAVLLWLVYLLPSWHSRHQYHAAERNAVRLNQALRVLAETSETPTEVHLELNARTALAQQRLARRAQVEQESASLEAARAELAAAKAQAVLDRERARAERRQAAADAALAQQRARAEA
ncbi:large exoprotein, partial [Microbacterium sp. 179-B 1A2 NHS]